MSTPENEKIENAESTIFSNPSHYNDEPRVVKATSNRKIIVSVICAVLALSIAIGGYFAVVNLLPEINEEGEALSGLSVSVLNISAAEVKSISVKNETTPFVMIPNVSETDGEQETEWTLEGINKAYTESDAIGDVADILLKLTAVQEVKDASGDYGFDKVKISADIVMKDDSKSYTVAFGDTAPANMGMYCRLSNSDKIYIVSSDNVLKLQSEPTDFAITTGFAALTSNSQTADCFKDGQIADFDYIGVTGSEYASPLKIEIQNDDAINAYFAYKITKPMERIANDEKVAELLSCFEGGISSQGAYCFEPTAADLKKYKLDNPEFTVTISLNGEKTSFSFSCISDTHCALIDESKDMIHKIPISNLPLANNKIEDYYSTFIMLEAMSGIDEVITKTPDGKVYPFRLQYTPKDEDKGIDEDKYQAFYGGNELDIANFKRYYSKLISLSPISYDYKTGLKTEAEITLKHTDNTPDTVLTFKKYSSGRYQVELNGIPMGLITATEFKEIMDDTPLVAENKTINE